MNKNIYKVLINGNELVMFHELEDVMIFIKGMSKYYNEFKININCTIKEELENGKNHL